MGKKSPFQQVINLVKGSDPMSVATGGPAGIPQVKGAMTDSADKVQAAKDKVSADAVAADTAKQAQAARDSIENDRMSAGSKSRTLLTGPAGLDDEEENKSVSRRVLMGS